MRWKRLVFPLVNGLILGLYFLMGGATTGQLLQWFAAGFILGIVLGALVEWGLAWLTHMEHPLYKRRLLIMAVFQLLLTGFVAIPVSYAFNLTAPKQHALCPTQAASCPSPDEFGAAYTDEIIAAADFVEIAAWYIPPDDSTSAVILIAHGLGGNRSGGLWHAKQLHAAGYGVLAYDARAHGESTGDFAVLHDYRDVPHLIDWLALEHGIQQVGGIGLSMGAHTMIHAAAVDDRLNAIILDGMAINRSQDSPEFTNTLEFLVDITNPAADLALATVAGERVPPVTELMQQIEDEHVFLIGGMLDWQEARYYPHFQQVAPQGFDFWLIPNAPHTGGPLIAPKRYGARMTAFFDRAFEIER